MDSKILKCPICGASELAKKVVHNYEYRTPMGIITIEGDVKFDACSHCKEVFIPGELINSWNLQILGQLSNRPAILTSDELKFVFSILPYSQTEIAEATGKVRSTLTKYKTGENPIDRLFDDTLKSIVFDFLKGKRTTLDRLNSRAQFVPIGESIKSLKTG